MKKIIVLCLLVAVFAAGCRERQKEPMPPVSQDATHNAMNSLDYAGTYVSEDDMNPSGIHVVELLSDDLFHVILMDGSEVTGLYIWDDTGSTVKLRAQDETIVGEFFVGENFLQLTTGDAAGQIFRKQSM